MDDEYIKNAEKIISQWCRQHLLEAGCDSFKLELGDGKFVMAGTLSGIRSLVEMEGK